MFQRTASLISSMQHLYTQTDKHLCPYCSTGGWPRGAGMGKPGTRRDVLSCGLEEVASGEQSPKAPAPALSEAGLQVLGRHEARFEGIS